MKPKFDDCQSCRYFLRSHQNPICRECDIGEFFEPRQRTGELTDNELIREFRDMYEGENDDR